LPCTSVPTRTSPNRGNHKSHAPAFSSRALSPEDAFYLTVFENALAFFGSRVLHPARPAFRDADLAELYELTHEDLEHQTALPFADAVEALNLIIQFRDPTNGQSAAPGFLAQALALTGRKQEYVTEQLGYLAGNDLYDAYVQGRLKPAALRKLFLAHVDEPRGAREAYCQLIGRLR